MHIKNDINFNSNMTKASKTNQTNIIFISKLNQQTLVLLIHQILYNFCSILIFSFPRTTYTQESLGSMKVPLML